MRVLSILVRAGTASFPTAEADLKTLFDTQLPNARRDVVVVDNLLSPGEHERGPGRVVIGGDNGAREFSAFDAGVRYVGKVLHDYDWVQLGTSAFQALYSDYLRRFDEPVLRAVETRAVCLGHIDCYNEPVRVHGYPSQHWVRTAFMMLPPSEVRLLGSLVSVRDRERLFTGCPEQPFRDDAPLCERYRRYIIDWLTGSDIGQGVVWHSRIPLEEDTLRAFEDKALAILNEHLLGIRLRAQGTVIADVTWLSSEVRGGVGVDWQTPWREQLAHRDRDAIALPTV